MAMTSASANRAFLPEEVSDLIVQPVEAASVALQVATPVYTGDQVSRFRVPIVTVDPNAAWVAEGQPITPTDATLDETDSPFYGLKGLTIISNELALDSSPEAAQIVGDGLARDIARKLDAAWFGLSGSAAQPAGLEDLTGINDVYTETVTWEDLDHLVEAIYAAEAAGATLTAFCANPADALALAQLKDQAASNRPLLGVDASTPTRRQIAGVPLYVSSAVTAGTIWGIPKPRVLIAIRQDVDLKVDESAYFGNDQTGIRAVFRVAFAFPHEAAIQKVMLGDAGS